MSSPEEHPASSAALELIRLLQALPFRRDPDKVRLDFSHFPEQFCKKFKDTPPEIIEVAVLSVLSSEIISPEITMAQYAQQYKNRKAPIASYALPLEVTRNTHQAITDHSEGNKLSHGGLIKLQKILVDSMTERLDALSTTLPDMKTCIRSSGVTINNGIQPTFLMSRPDAWENEILNYPNKFIFVALNLAQLSAWETMKDTIEALGGHAKVIPGSENVSHRHPFVRDPLVVLPNNTVVLPMFGDNHNRMSQPVIKKYLQSAGYSQFREVDCDIEGGNVVVYPEKKIIFVGGIDGITGVDGSRRNTCAENARQIRRLIPDYKVVPVLLKNDYVPIIFHLDQCLGYVGKGKFITCMSALTSEGQKALRDHIPAENTVNVLADEAKKGACNVLMVGDTAVCPHLSARTRDELKKKDVTTIDPESLGLPLNTFNMTDGSIHCATLELPSAEVLKKLSVAQGDRTRR